MKQLTLTYKVIKNPFYNILLIFQKNMISTEQVYNKKIKNLIFKYRTHKKKQLWIIK